MMTEDFARWFFALYFRGDHHIPGPLKPFGTGWAVSMTNEVATWDFDGMTRLVVMAHDNHVRASLVPKGMSRSWLVIHPRPAGNKALDHPDLDWNVDRIREQLQAYDQKYLKALKIKAISGPGADAE